MTDPAVRRGWVLAGGASQRMGQDKARLAWRSNDLLGRAVEILEDAGAKSVLISGRPEHAGAIADDAPGLGPLGGLATLARRSPDGEVWVVAVDAPTVCADDLHALVANPTQRLCCFDGFPLPMWLRLDDALRARLDAALAHPDASQRALHVWQDSVGALRLPCTPERAARLRGANTPQEWAALRA